MSDAHDTILDDYLDALLADAPLPEHAAAENAAAWRLCELGRLLLLLPNAALGAAITCANLPDAPMDWHLARIHVSDRDWRVMDLARCIAPGLAAPMVDNLLPVTGSDWLLAVPGHPQPLALPADAIQWRPHRNSRAWLAGMSRDGRYMALDVHILVAQAAETWLAAEDPTP